MINYKKINQFFIYKRSSSFFVIIFNEFAKIFYTKYFFCWYFSLVCTHWPLNQNKNIVSQANGIFMIKWMRRNICTVLELHWNPYRRVRILVASYHSLKP